ncbi:MAG: chemotaxis protein CheA [Chloroflexi bacterium]|nr:chemotaxis protein CheA [Chloroflexota bacterium]
MELRLDATPEELPLFVAETDELLLALDEQLIRLEHDGPRPELLQEVFRAAHTIKGSSAAIGHLRMAKLTHAMESLLDKLRHGEIEITPPRTERLFESLDMLKLLAAEVESREMTDLDVDGLVAKLDIVAQTGDSAGGVRAGRPVESIRPSSIEPIPDGATHHVLVKIEAADWAAVRALQTLLAIEEIGELLVSRPTRAEIERQQVNERLEAFVQTERTVDEIRETLEAVPEISLLSLAEVDAMAESADATTAERRVSAISGVTAASGEHADAGANGVAKRGNARAGGATVRIDVERLDRLLNLVGELVIDRTRMLGLGRALQDQFGEHHLFSEISETTFHLGRITDELQSEVMKSRMLPIGTVFSRFPRVVRDLSTRQQKKVELVIEGQETELDRSVIEEIGDPLVHLLRNAVDHGIEPPADRLTAGKPEVATVRLTAEHVENSIVIAVEDDGRGIDAAKIRAKALERGVITSEAAARMSDAEAVDLVFAPGFSTAAVVTDVSGRGVGMDIVRTNVERLGGTVEVHTRPGQGSRFMLRLPLTLAIVQALLVRVGGGIYALPLSSVTETLRVPLADVQRLQQQEAILLRGRVLPVVRLTSLFRCDSEIEGSAKDVLVVAVKVGERQVGLAVDRLLGEQEVVIKSLGDLIGDVPGISSAAILGDGSVALIVDVPMLVQRLATDRYERRWTDARDVGQSVRELQYSA